MISKLSFIRFLNLLELDAKIQKSSKLIGESHCNRKSNIANPLVLLEDFLLNPIQDCWGGGGGPKGPTLTSFSPATSTNVGVRPQNFLTLTFSFNPFGTLARNFKFVPSVSPNLLNLNQDHPS